MKIKNLKIYGLGILTMVVFPVLGILLYGIIEGTYSTIINSFSSDFNMLIQIIVGGAVGSLFGFLAWQMVKSNYMRPVLVKYGHVVKSLNLSVFTIFFLSLCAGVGEEFFFRGILQDYLGVVIAAILFVLIHGYLNPFDKIIFVYGLLMTSFIVCIGYMDVYLGLLSAMSAHMAIDVILFYKLTNTNLENIAKVSKEDVLSVENNL
ncbi:MAG: CPBP family intramembrane metalloprotease [Flavobacteriales bacterium]|nr:CPBP family intramembrane metalloprotease [Flavobacteriales bacterium]